ncbi:ABC transporter ATP-binding protein [Entomospira nematocerorum]|uniref:Spermidine/putrescine import ATP-binding protein PotA n=1 Tax=Entomospira nematocerorum TaxID=2719987 RepID=A0A968KVI8_9SPIO|nr:ABC transporter ATP-binding protein [Entomospira nematocera]NIZ47358.1 ABC transporter ATP-binding protein [Entomospira nematocera]WDI34101.1 ABC transporter ATP-binding protein [Entomospira nematocera]
MKGSVVRFENVKKSFGDFVAVKEANIEIRSGEFFSLLGPSGCGKTTLLRMLAGFEVPTSGAIYLDDVNVTALAPDKRPVNTVFQNYALFPHLSVFENVAFPLRLQKRSKSEINQRVEEYLELVQLTGKAGNRISQLSGGQKQRVAIARALINEPKVLLLDEPLSALDAKLRQRMLVQLDRIHDEVGVTFVFVTHDQSEALSISDRIAVMNAGQVEQLGEPFEIYESPVSAFVANFIGETNLFTGEVIGVEGDWVDVRVQSIGVLKVTADDDIKPKVGDTINLTVRPEKISLGKDKPRIVDQKPGEYNLFHGVIHDMIYLGSESKCFITLDGSEFVFRAIKPHSKYLDDGPEITWEDTVYFWWHANDAYIVAIVEEASQS